jgi:hypothetical protein
VTIKFFKNYKFSLLFLHILFTCNKNITNLFIFIISLNLLILKKNEESFQELRPKLFDILAKRKLQNEKEKKAIQADYNKRWKTWRKHLVKLYEDGAILSEPESDVYILLSLLFIYFLRKTHYYLTHKLPRYLIFLLYNTLLNYMKMVLF